MDLDVSDALALLRDEVASRFGVSRDLVRVVVAPYRICLLGAHIDHQLGPVASMAINRAVHLAFAPSGSPTVHLVSKQFPGDVQFSIAQVPEKQPGDWGNYVRGAVGAIQKRHLLRQGIVGITAGSLADGGLSSSAAFGVACLLALEAANGLDVSADENILLDQEIENEYLGMRIGILDQSAILLARRDHLTYLDCATREYGWLSSPPGMPPWKILVAFSGMTKALTSTDYNLRVLECTEAARTLLAAAGRAQGTAVLRSVSPGEYAEHRHLLEGALARRAKHFFEESDRVARGREAWLTGDLREFGRLMTASGESSVHNYECGAPPLTALFELLAATPGVYGARFSGAGFRGCCVALVDAAQAEAAAAHVEQAYKALHPELAEKAGTLLCLSDDGARILKGVSRSW